MAASSARMPPVPRLQWLRLSCLCFPERLGAAGGSRLRRHGSARMPPLDRPGTGPFGGSAFRAPECRVWPSRRFLRIALRPSVACKALAKPLSARPQRILPRGCAGLRRGPRGPSPSAASHGQDGLAFRGLVLGRLWRGAGRARTAILVFRPDLGALVAPGGLGGALLALVALYLPGVLVVFGTLPQWERLRGIPWARVLLAGVNAAVVGLLAAAFYSPIWTSAITGSARLILALAAYCALQFRRIPPWAVVAACALAGALCFA